MGTTEPGVVRQVTGDAGLAAWWERRRAQGQAPPLSWNAQYEMRKRAARVREELAREAERLQAKRTAQEERALRMERTVAVALGRVYAQLGGSSRVQQLLGATRTLDPAALSLSQVEQLARAYMLLAVRVAGEAVLWYERALDPAPTRDLGSGTRAEWRRRARQWREMRREWDRLTAAWGSGDGPGGA